MFELSSSLISIIASPVNVVSVLVGKVGDGGVISFRRVSPVMARGGTMFSHDRVKRNSQHCASFKEKDVTNFAQWRKTDHMNIVIVAQGKDCGG